MKVNLNNSHTGYPVLYVANTCIPSLGAEFSKFAIPQTYQTEMSNLLELEKQIVLKRKAYLAQIRAKFPPTKLETLKAEFLKLHPELLL